MMKKHWVVCISIMIIGLFLWGCQENVMLFKTSKPTEEVISIGESLGYHLSEYGRTDYKGDAYSSLLEEDDGKLFVHYTYNMTEGARFLHLGFFLPSEATVNSLSKPLERVQWSEMLTFADLMIGSSHGEEVYAEAIGYLEKQLKSRPPETKMPVVFHKKIGEVYYVVGFSTKSNQLDTSNLLYIRVMDTYTYELIIKERKNAWVRYLSDMEKAEPLPITVDLIEILEVPTEEKYQILKIKGKIKNPNESNYLEGFTEEDERDYLLWNGMEYRTATLYDNTGSMTVALINTSLHRAALAQERSHYILYDPIEDKRLILFSVLE